MNKFTKGKWEVKENGVWDISVKSNGGTICHISNKGEWFPKEDSLIGRSNNKMLADATLISSAPDLLETLEHMTDAIKETSYHAELEHIGRLVMHAESVIKKARGTS